MRMVLAWLSKPAPLLVVALLCGWSFGAERTPSGYLELTIIDRRSKEITPARVELLDEKRQPHVPKRALRVAGDCGWFPIHNWVPGTASWQVRRHLRAEVANPYTGTTQFYWTRSVRMRLPTGRYALRAFKGIEFRVMRREVDVRRNEVTTLTMPLERWIDMPSEGWYSADDHLHIPRPNSSFDDTIARWMEAEDLHVANLLQMGLSRSIHITPQHSFGKRSIYQVGSTVLASGQENPRTHVLGHSITLGASKWLDFPKTYLAYDRVWREAKREGAINGFAHWGVGGADQGMALWIPERLLDFLEVLGFGLSYYDSWYELLNLGVRMTPTAGTDYPCSQSVPGRERFYTRPAGPLTYPAWIDAVQRGRTFITNGPIIELRINGREVGDQIHLEGAATIDIEGRVRFDPERDDVKVVELVSAGDVVFSIRERIRPGEIRFRVQLPAGESTWIALRARGEKLDETPVDSAGLRSALSYVDRPSNAEILRRIPDTRGVRSSAAHTAPIYVTVGTRSIANQAKASEAAKAWLARLDELEALLADEHLSKLAGFPGRGDGLTLHDLQSGRADLIRDIKRARNAYRQWQSK